MIPRFLIWLATGPIAPGTKRYDWIIARSERFKWFQFLLILWLFPFFCIASWIRFALKKILFCKPSVLWAPTPILTLSESSAVLNNGGFRSRTLVFTVYFITNRFDYNMRPVLDNPAVNQWFTGYLFLWSLLRFDIFHFFYDGGLWSGMKIVPWARWIEFPLLRLAGKRIVATAYGADVRSRGRNEMWQPWNICRECPDPGRSCICDDRAALRMARYHREWCNGLLAMGDMHDFVYGSDPNFVYWPIDVKQVAYIGAPDRRPGEPIVVAHSPNHRHFKGTRFIEGAVERLQARGVNLQLDLVERVSNVEAKRRYAAADIVFAQCILGWPGYTEIEAMAAGKPVLTYVRDHDLYLNHVPTWPALSVTPDTVDAVLGRLVADAGERKRLGEEGRRHAEEYWSYEALEPKYAAYHTGIWRKGGLFRTLRNKANDLSAGDLRTRAGDGFDPVTPGEFAVWTDPSEEMKRLDWGIWGRPAFNTAGRALVHGPDGAFPHPAADGLAGMTAVHLHVADVDNGLARTRILAAAEGLRQALSRNADGIVSLASARDAYVLALPDMPRRARALRGLALPIAIRAWKRLNRFDFADMAHDLAFALCQPREAGGAWEKIGATGTFLDSTHPRDLTALSAELQCALALIEYDALVDSNWVMPRVQMAASNLCEVLETASIEALIDEADLGADFRMDDLFFVIHAAGVQARRTRRPELALAAERLQKRFRKHRWARFRAYAVNL